MVEELSRPELFGPKSAALCRRGMSRVHQKYIR